MSHLENLTRIKAVSNLFGPLGKDVAFVGGAVISVYADHTSPEVRPTDDVDIVIEILSYAQYSQLDEKLRKLGFVNDRESGIICRYNIHGMIVDVMPTEGKVLNFTNRWYPDGYKNAIEYYIDPQHKIKIFPAPYFLASKIEAFNDRGGKDGRTSNDFEDIVFLLEQRPLIWDEILTAPADVREYISNEFRKLLSNSFISEWIGSNLSNADPTGARQILNRMKEIAVK